MRVPVIDPGSEDDGALPPPRGRMVSLTLLDGTTITLPARDKKKKSDPPSWPSEDLRGLPMPEDRPTEEGALTARDLVAALRAVAHGADATEILGSNTRISMSRCSSTVLTVYGIVGLVDDGRTFGKPAQRIMSGAWPPPAPSV